MLAIRLYNENSSGHLAQTCPALAIKTATILELVNREEQEKWSRSRVSRSCKKNNKNKGQNVNQIPGTSSCSERVARTHPHERQKKDYMVNKGNKVTYRQVVQFADNKL